MSESELASREIVVDGSDVAGVTLTLSKGATAHGRIRFDTGSRPQGLRPSQVFAMPTLMDPQMSGMSGSDSPVTRDDWTFELKGLRGRGFIRAGALSDWQLRRVRLEGVDVGVFRQQLQRTNEVPPFIFVATRYKVTNGLTLLEA